jgi:zona occludens toxin
MAITLVTGLPGHGKTLYTLAKWKPEAEKAGRPVFHNSIPDLNIPGWQTWDVAKWQDLPAGSLLVVDEAQFAFPVTGRGQTPEWVQKLATHRHLGLDIIVITQNPMLLDAFVRRLVDRHFHVVRKFGTRFATIYEFVNGAKEDVAKSRADGIRHEFRYPKEVFGWYKSAELHTVKARIPMRVFALLILPVLFVGLVYAGYQRMKPDARTAQMNEAMGLPAASSVVKPGLPAESRPGGYGRAERLTPAEYVAAHVPRIEGLPHTAAIYDGVTQPREAPYPAACIAMSKRCQCYSQQGTRLDMREALCRQIADGGFFVAWSTLGERVASQRVAPSPTQPVAQAPPSAGGFHTSLSTQFAAAQAEPDAGGRPPRVRRDFNK